MTELPKLAALARTAAIGWAAAKAARAIVLSDGVEAVLKSDGVGDGVACKRCRTSLLGDPGPIYRSTSPLRT